ncbi:MAG: NVEALA domain-containing protein [Dysgonomonas sp.]
MKRKLKMKRKFFISIGVLTITATIAFNINLDRKSNNISLTLSNVEALASEDDKKTDFWCCGSSGTCAKGTDENTGREFEIVGRLSKTKCK